MKKLLALLLAMTMLLCLAACGDDSKKNDKDDKGGNTTTAAASTEAQGDSTTTTTVGESDATVTENGDTSATEGGETSATQSESTEAPTSGTKAPTSATKTPTSATKAPTSATKAPTTTTRPTEPEEPDEPVDTRPTIKILSIGHSFSRDAMDTYMADLWKAAGYNATFGYLYYPGASLERQYHYVKDNTTSYEHYNKCVDGTWYRNGSANAEQALADEDWDIVTFQPSPDYGKGTMSYNCEWGCNGQIDNDYVHFDQLVRLVKDKLADVGNEDVKFYWHLTWAFATDCKLWSFTYSNYNQNTMYWDFIKATGKYVTPNPYVEDAFIPCITSIQNVRTSWMGDTFNEPGNNDPNADGYHLNDKGDLVAAMTWVAFFSGKSATEFKISTKYSDEQYAAFAEAVDNAIKKPLNITKSSYTTEP